MIVMDACRCYLIRGPSCQHAIHPDLLVPWQATDELGGARRQSDDGISGFSHEWRDDTLPV